MITNKGIILAGGTGSRLYPMTKAVNKQLLPIYDKPTIYYPLTTLMLAGIKEILIITTPNDISSVKELLEDGSSLGLQIKYQVQDKPNGLPEAFILGKEFINNEPVALILGDNVFHGQGLSTLVSNVSTKDANGAHLFAYSVNDPRRYGVVVLDTKGKPVEIEEKPENPKSKLAVTGLYFYDEHVCEIASSLKPSKRGETEITDLNRIYIENNNAYVHILGRGSVWFDVGTPEALAQASDYIRVLESRQAIGIASPEEVAWRMNFINDDKLNELIYLMPDSQYSRYLSGLLEQ